MHLPALRRGSRRSPDRGWRRSARRRRTRLTESSTDATVPALPGSSWPVGSSASTSRGSPASARAIATRWAWPPDSSSGSCVGELREPEHLERAGRAQPRLGVGARRRARSGSATFSTTSSGGSRLGPWKTTATGPGRSRSPSAGHVTRPTVGRVEPGEQVQQRRLAGPGRPDERDPRAGVDLEVDRLHRDRRGVAGAVRATLRLRSGRAGQRSREPPVPEPDLAVGVGRDRARRGWRRARRCRARRGSRSRSSTRAAVASSSSPVGSSARITGGSLASATARPARASSPPESWRGRARARAAIPSASSSSARHAAARAAAQALSERDVVGDRQVVDEVALLEQHPDLPRAQAGALALAAARQALAGDVARCRRRARRARPGRPAASTCRSPTAR